MLASLSPLALPGVVIPSISGVSSGGRVVSLATSWSGVLCSVIIDFFFQFVCLFVFLYPPYPKDRGMLWFYVKAARRPSPAARRLPPAARNGVNAITQKPRDGLFSNLVYTLVVIVS